MHRPGLGTAPATPPPLPPLGGGGGNIIPNPLGSVKQNTNLFLLIQVQVGTISVAVPQGVQKDSRRKFRFLLARFRRIQ
jgi:hypothetical protein